MQIPEKYFFVNILLKTVAFLVLQVRPTGNVEWLVLGSEVSCMFESLSPVRLSSIGPLYKSNT